MYPSIPQILIILVILLLLFGHKRIREFGKSLGEALRDFKKGLEGKSDEPKPMVQEKDKKDLSPPPASSQDNSNQDNST